MSFAQRAVPCAMAFATLVNCVVFSTSDSGDLMGWVRWGALRPVLGLWFFYCFFFGICLKKASRKKRGEFIYYSIEVNIFWFIHFLVPMSNSPRFLSMSLPRWVLRPAAFVVFFTLRGSRDHSGDLVVGDRFRGMGFFLEIFLGTFFFCKKQRTFWGIWEILSKDQFLVQFFNPKQFHPKEVRQSSAK